MTNCMNALKNNGWKQNVRQWNRCHLDSICLCYTRNILIKDGWHSSSVGDCLPARTDIYNNGVQRRQKMKNYKKLYETYSAAQKKYREKKKDYYREYHRKWQQDNKERVSQYQKEWRAKKKQIDNGNKQDNINTI